jgi:2-succinyl-5-enolpyruvyl-6-hydroxy-3-cyclohexene-1-carboxylate synthase
VNPSTAQARVLVDELVRCGVRQVVVCPGSRNAPLSIALHAAALAGRLTLHVRIDERSAGFFALGLAKGSAAPVAITCTSGTAVANLHPAVLEAHHAGVGLLLLTADRPAELQSTGANQTIAQRGVFGAAASVVDFPVAERRAGQNAIWRATVCRAVAAAADGPVQVNLPLREPLVPDADPDWPEPLAGRAREQPWTVVSTREIVTGQQLPDLGSRVLLVLGDGEQVLLTEAATAAAAAGWPVLAEPTALGAALAAGAELIANGALIMSGAELPEALRPSGLVVAGRPTLARWVAKLMRATPAVHVVDANPRWTDPAHAAHSVSTRLTPAEVPARQQDPGWLAGWRQVDDAVAVAVHKFLADQPWPTGLQVAREVVAALPADALLLLGSSNPVRLVDLVATPRADLRVHANRGVAGIDGSVSTAAGLAIGAGRPGYALLGDLTFLHDTNGLLLGPAEQRPDLTVVVLNDGGGGIFSLLEQGAPEHAESFERVFGTPHQVDLAALCAAHRVPHRRVRTVSELRSALAAEPGLRVVEVPVPREGLRAAHGVLRAAVDEALT